MNQLLNPGYEVYEPESGDFLANGITIEVGGKNKSSKQVLEANEFMISADEIETGWGHRCSCGSLGFCIEVLGHFVS